MLARRSFFFQTPLMASSSPLRKDPRVSEIQKDPVLPARICRSSAGVPGLTLESARQSYLR